MQNWTGYIDFVVTDKFPRGHRSVSPRTPKLLLCFRRDWPNIKYDIIKFFPYLISNFVRSRITSCKTNKTSKFPRNSSGWQSVSEFRRYSLCKPQKNIWLIFQLKSSLISFLSLPLESMDFVKRKFISWRKKKIDCHFPSWF